MNGYKTHNFYRKCQHRRAGRNSEGIVLLYKNSIADGIAVVRNHFDTILWIKLDKNFCKVENDIYLCGTYIWGQDSPAYNIHNQNLFEIIENVSCYFKRLGVVMIAGDWNRRVGLKSDYVTNDRMNAIIDGDDYVPDTPLDRTSMDATSNHYGSQLLDLCKATGLRICNGRLETMGAFTYNGYRSNTVIHYLLCEQSNFKCIQSYNVLDFNI